MSEQVVLGLDVGTTAVKAAAFGVGHRFRALVTQDNPLQHPEPRFSVQDPDQVADAVTAAIGELVRGLSGQEVRCLGVSTAMHGLIGLDEARRPITPVITWADSRAKEVAAELAASPAGQALWQRSGMPVHSMAPLTKLHWLAEHQPDTFAQARWWISLKDWVIHVLTGEWVTELSSAGAMGLLDVATRTWSPDSLSLAGITIDQLLPIAATTDSLPLSSDLARSWGLPAAIPVVLGAGDGPLGNLGTRALDPGVAGLSIGTSGALRVITDRPVTDPASGLFSYPLTDELWAVGGAISNGGSAMRWFADFAASLSEVADDERDEAAVALAAAVPPGADGLGMIPYLLAERSPTWDPALAGAYVGVRARHTPAHFARATIEGVAQQLWVVLQQLRRHLPHQLQVREVRATGGVFRAPLWAEVVAGVLDLPATVTDDAEGSALGAAALAFFATGGAGNLREAVAELAVGDHDPAPVVAAPAAVAAYGEARVALQAHLRQSAGLADLFERCANL